MKRILAILLLCCGMAMAAPKAVSRARPAMGARAGDRDIPEPARRGSNLSFEFINNTFFQELQKLVDVPRTWRRLQGDYQAWNVNTMDEVPDSSWLTNRITTGKLTPEQIERGANVHPAPAFGETILIVDGKKKGASPGLILKDSEGTVWHVKFDVPDYPEMQSAAEVITSRLLWAAGYNVPEEWIAAFRREQLRIGPKATAVDANGRKQAMTEAYVNGLLNRVARRPDGSYRVVASRHLDRLKGPSGWTGRRSDDANDLIPHEQRRDLRGLRVICAWLNHEDIKAEHTVSRYVRERGNHFLKHYLWDFGSSLGSDGIAPKYVRSGHANAFDTRGVAATIAVAGLHQPHWKSHPLPITYPSIGRFGSADFDPDTWKPTIPNRAFDNMTAADAYWAAKIVGSFSGADIRAAVRAGELSDPGAEAYLVETLAERRDIIVKRYFGRVSPVEEVTAHPVQDRTQHISFTDLGAGHRADALEPVYTYRFFLTNGPGGPKAISPVLGSNEQSLTVPPEVFKRLDEARARAGDEADPPMVSIELRVGRARPVRAYFVYEGPASGLRFVGLEHAA